MLNSFVNRQNKFNKVFVTSNVTNKNTKTLSNSEMNINSAFFDFSPTFLKNINTVMALIPFFL